MSDTLKITEENLLEDTANYWATHLWLSVEIQQNAPEIDMFEVAGIKPPEDVTYQEPEPSQEESRVHETQVGVEAPDEMYL